MTTEIQIMNGNGVPELSLHEARDLVDRIRNTNARLHEQMEQAALTGQELSSLIEMAYTQRAWEPMGYPSWQSMCESEFSEARLWDTIETRRATARQLLENVGMSTRAIAAVLGVGKSTVERDTRDLATGPFGTVANGPIRGIDGKERQRPTPVELTDRRLLVAQKRAEGLSQEAIAEQLGVTQRTISNDTQAIAAYMEQLDTESVERMNTGQITRDEFAQLAGIEHISTTQNGMIREANAAARSLSDHIRYIETNLILNNAWPAERRSASASLVPALVHSVRTLTKWLANEVDWNSISYEDRHAFGELLANAGNDAFFAQEHAQDTQSA